MSNGSPFPLWLQDAVCDDAAFDAAYAGLSGRRRAWIKKSAAQIFEMSGAGARASSVTGTCWTQGFSSAMHVRPVDGVLLLLDSGCRSAARAAAAALPAVASGAPAMALCLDDAPSPDLPAAPDVLAALELCGLEAVVRLDIQGIHRLAEHVVAQGPRLAVLALGSGPACEEAAALAFAAPGMSVWTPWTFPAPSGEAASPPDLGVWAGDGADWDLDLVAWAHAGHPVAVWDAPDAASGPLPLGMEPERGDFDAFLDHGHRALIVPASRLAEAEGAADLVLGPGQEGCWAWPGLTPGFFLRRSLRLDGGA